MTDQITQLERQLAEAQAHLNTLLRYEGHMVWCGHGNDDSRPCVCGLLRAQDAARAAIQGEPT